jgi:hypothetical protein
LAKRRFLCHFRPSFPKAWVYFSFFGAHLREKPSQKITRRKEKPLRPKPSLYVTLLAVLAMAILLWLWRDSMITLDAEFFSRFRPHGRFKISI